MRIKMIAASACHRRCCCLALRKTRPLSVQHLPPKALPTFVFFPDQQHPQHDMNGLYSPDGIEPFLEVRLPALFLSLSTQAGLGVDQQLPPTDG